MKTRSYQNSFSTLACSFVACWLVGAAPARAGDLDKLKPPGEQTRAGHSTNTFEEDFINTNHLKLRLESSGKTSWVAGYVTDIVVDEKASTALSESNLLQPVPVFLREPQAAGDNHPLGIFTRSLQEAIDRADLVAIQALYQTNGLSPKELSIELARWRTWFAEDPKPRYLSIIFRVLSKANKQWEDMVRNLTTHEATHLAQVTCRTEQSTGMLCFPLIEVEGRLLLVAEDKSSLPLGGVRFQQDGPAKGSQPLRSETNKTSSAAGPRR